MIVCSPCDVGLCHQCGGGCECKHEEATKC